MILCAIIFKNHKCLVVFVLVCRLDRSQHCRYSYLFGSGLLYYERSKQGGKLINGLQRLSYRCVTICDQQDNDYLNINTGHTTWFTEHGFGCKVNETTTISVIGNATTVSTVDKDVTGCFLDYKVPTVCVDLSVCCTDL